MRILIIEDEHKIAQAIKKGLEQESYAADIVYNGKEALGFAVSGDYDLVILDRMLPDIPDGLRICQAMRDKNINTPVLVLTAKDAIKDRVDGLDMGADDYLVKPFAFDELLARVRALLRRPQEHIGTRLTIDDLEMDTNSFEVKRSGKIIPLSNKEYGLLEYLLRNKGKTVTKDMITGHVWDYDADILPNTVEVYIGYLRNKIDKPFSGEPLIKTIRGFGYSLRK